jgi:hypothetical protein
LRIYPPLCSLLFLFYSSFVPIVIVVPEYTGGLFNFSSKVSVQSNWFLNFALAHPGKLHGDHRNRTNDHGYQ